MGIIFPNCIPAWIRLFCLMQKLDSIHQLGHYHKQLQSVEEDAVAAAGDDEPAAEDRFAEIEFEEMSKIVIKKRAYYQEN